MRPGICKLQATACVFPSPAIFGCGATQALAGAIGRPISTDTYSPTDLQILYCVGAYVLTASSPKHSRYHKVDELERARTGPYFMVPTLGLLYSRIALF